MAEGGEVCQIGGMDSEEKEIEEGHGDPFKSSFLKECGALGDSYIDIHVEEDSEEDPEEDTSNFQPSSTENQDLPSSENLLEWLYRQLKDLFSMDDILKSLQYFIDGGGEDAKVFNTVNLCEDDIEDGGRAFETASASSSLPKEQVKKEAVFEIESIDEESDKEEEEEEEDDDEWEGEDDEEVEVEEDGEKEDYEMASRSLNSPHLSNF
jgi:hypothetical protein